jgi:glycosyltransferase involved in cell wall biosynthesis
MIRIFEIISSVSLGGAENVAFTLVDKCSAEHPGKFEFIIVELYASKSFYALRKKVELRSKGVRVITLGGTSKRWSLLIGHFKLLYHIKKEKPTIIHAHTDLPDFVLGMVKKINRLKGIKIIRTIHNTELWSDHPLIGKIVESSYQEDTIIGCSKAALQAYYNLRKKNGLPISSRSTIIYNGCAIPKNESHHFRLDPKRVNIAFCGRFFYQKGIDILIQFLEKHAEEFQVNLLFHFVGDGPYKEKVLKLAERHSNVIAYGSVTNLSRKIHDFDFLIMPSRFEGLPLISLESSLSKVPVIAARAPGLDETLPTEWPLFFNLDNSLELKTILEKIASHTFTKENLKEIAFQYVSEKFSMEEMTRAYSAQYLEE